MIQPSVSTRYARLRCTTASKNLRRLGKRHCLVKAADGAKGLGADRHACGRDAWNVLLQTSATKTAASIFRLAFFIARFVYHDIDGLHSFIPKSTRHQSLCLLIER